MLALVTWFPPFILASDYQWCPTIPNLLYTHAHTVLTAGAVNVCYSLMTSYSGYSLLTGTTPYAALSLVFTLSWPHNDFLYEDDTCVHKILYDQELE